MNTIKIFLEKLPLTPSLFVFLVGVVILVITSFGQLPVGHEVLTVKEETWRVFLGTIGIGVTTWGAALIWRENQNPRLSNPIVYDYDVFLAVPMAAFGQDKTAYDSQKKETEAVIAAIFLNFQPKALYCAGSKITSPEQFEPEEVAAEIDLEAIRRSKCFIMLYPEKIVSSVIFEAGYALAFGKESTYFIRSREDLPFMMKHLELVSNKYANVKIYEFESIDKVVEKIKGCGRKLFSERN